MQEDRRVRSIFQKTEVSGSLPFLLGRRICRSSPLRGSESQRRGFHPAPRGCSLFVGERPQSDVLLLSRPFQKSWICTHLADFSSKNAMKCDIPRRKRHPKPYPRIRAPKQWRTLLHEKNYTKFTVFCFLLNVWVFMTLMKLFSPSRKNNRKLITKKFSETWQGK